MGQEVEIKQVKLPEKFSEEIIDLLDNGYGYKRRTDAYPIGEIAFYYSIDLKKYFEIINMSIGFETT